MHPISRRSRHATFALAAGALLLPFPLLSDPGDLIGSNFVVNTTTTNIQVDPRIAVDADGDFVVVWAGGAGGAFECSSGCSIYAQRFDRDGTSIGPEFQVPSTTVGLSEENPDVAMDDAGDFVVVWDRYDPAGDGTADGVMARRFDADGNPLGAEFQVSAPSATLENFNPSVASNASGAFAVTWETDESDTGDFILAARFASDGSPIGSTITVNTPVPFTGLTGPSVALDASGRFVVAWFQKLLTAAGYHLVIRRFDENGLAQGDETQVDASTTDVRAGSVAMDAAGNFVLTWSEPDADPNVFFRIYDGNGVALAGPTQANAEAGGTRPRIEMHEGGVFALTWLRHPPGSSSDIEDVWVRVFDADGTPISDERRVSAALNAETEDPDVGFGRDGQLVVTWQGSDGDEWGVLAQRIEAPDVTPPSATIAVADPAIGAGESSSVTITFSEAPVGFTLDDLTAENATLSSLAEVSATEFTAMLTVGSVADATNVVTLAADSYQDAAGNPGAASTSNNYEIEAEDGGGGGGSLDWITLLGLFVASTMMRLTGKRCSGSLASF